jgi:hypothetical protein
MAGPGNSPAHHPPPSHWNLAMRKVAHILPFPHPWFCLPQDQWEPPRISAVLSWREGCPEQKPTQIPPVSVRHHTRPRAERWERVCCELAAQTLQALSICTNWEKACSPSAGQVSSPLLWCHQNSEEPLFKLWQPARTAFQGLKTRCPPTQIPPHSHSIRKAAGGGGVGMGRVEVTIWILLQSQLVVMLNSLPAETCWNSGNWNFGHQDCNTLCR